MNQAEHFLHTTHRTITWFNKAFQANELELKPPFQRNAVWTNAQKSYLLDTVLSGLPIPELYMQDLGDSEGSENHIVVDGQQRIRAVLDFVQGNFALHGEDVTRSWRGLKFDDLSPDDKKSVFSYKFVVRILPPDLNDDDIRRIFARLNKNVVSLTDQELRNATYWGPFIKTIQRIADDDPFWSECGVFSANDYRRMLDHEFISELAVAYLHGAQNKKDRLDYYYRLYEEEFDAANELVEVFTKVAFELGRMMTSLDRTRWKKKSDFYTMFLQFAERRDSIPFDEAQLDAVTARIIELGQRVDQLLRLDEAEWKAQDPSVVAYAQNVARAASDKNSRVARANAFSRFVFEEPHQTNLFTAEPSLTLEEPLQVDLAAADQIS